MNCEGEDLNEGEAPPPTGRAALLAWSLTGVTAPCSVVETHVASSN